MAWSVDTPWMLGIHLQVLTNQMRCLANTQDSQDGAVGVTYPLHGELGENADQDGQPDGQPDGQLDGQAEQVDEEEDLKHLASFLAKGSHQSSCYYRLSMLLPSPIF